MIEGKESYIHYCGALGSVPMVKFDMIS